MYACYINDTFNDHKSRPVLHRKLVNCMQRIQTLKKLYKQTDLIADVPIY